MNGEKCPIISLAMAACHLVQIWEWEHISWVLIHSAEQETHIYLIMLSLPGINFADCRSTSKEMLSLIKLPLPLHAKQFEVAKTRNISKHYNIYPKVPSQESPLFYHVSLPYKFNNVFKRKYKFWVPWFFDIWAKLS